jgi:hypothetical protein
VNLKLKVSNTDDYKDD